MKIYAVKIIGVFFCAGGLLFVSMVTAHEHDVHADHKVIKVEKDHESFMMIFQTDPKIVRAGARGEDTLQKTALLFTPSDTNLEEAHGALMHVIGVRRDLNYFFHTHAERGEGGVFVARHLFVAPGVYKLWAEVVHEGTLHRFEYFLAVRSADSWWQRLTRSIFI